jgi:hypothetical protein
MGFAAAQSAAVPRLILICVSENEIFASVAFSRVIIFTSNGF